MGGGVGFGQDGGEACEPRPSGAPKSVTVTEKESHEHTEGSSGWMEDVFLGTDASHAFSLRQTNEHHLEALSLPP